MKLSHATLKFSAKGTPESEDFGDVYFSNEDGLAESEYVFLNGNQLWLRWLAWQESTFCIAETGFGTGLNFLLTVKLFDTFLQTHPQAPLKYLHFISLEKHPIEAPRLAEIYQNWPSLKQYSTSVLKKYPPALEGIHRSVHSTGSNTSANASRNDISNHKNMFCISLDLVLGDAHSALCGLHNIPSGLVNAWYLDGFAPSKNLSMWCPEVFQQMARLSASDASLATFTAAGSVKRGLEAVGFCVKKIKGFGRKREMITACFNESKSDSKAEQQAPYFYRFPAASAAHNQAPKSVAIIGGGIAGALLALRLTALGMKVCLVCKDRGPALAASGNPIAGVYPQLNAEASVNSQFFVHAFLYARRCYDDFLSQGIEFEHDWCSVLQLGFNENTRTRLQKMLDKDLWPDTLAKIVSAEQATEIAGIEIPHPALHLPECGWIAPVSLIHACLQKANSTGLLSTLFEHELLSYQSDDAGVELTISRPNGEHTKIDTECLVIAAGADSGTISQQILPMRLTRGQVEAIKAGETSKNLQAVLCHKGYFTPSVHGKHALGSTYIKQDNSCDYRETEANKNVQMHKQAMGDIKWMQEIETMSVQHPQGRAAIRCSTPDHLPLVGAMPDIRRQTLDLRDLYKALPLHRYPAAKNIQHVYVLTGLGSRGITTAPILVDTLVAQITHSAFPLNTNLLDAIAPNRFLVRNLIRQQPYLKT